MQIFLRHQGIHSIECNENDRIYALKLKIEQSHQIPVDEQILYHQGQVLEDDQIIAEHLTQDANVDLNLRLLGGKVHGSLARAGKVRAQTPKVEKQEKKKKPTGRAKRRIQYNRRFVNAVKFPGRRRGPNANS
ncbi:hypothetical protein SSS_10724 [Sarcoptes scabiei]|uniref:40S ribosomal protein S30 n=1 Tax=Sarcoptes scabiei TaxID=52283 RepID=A0A132A6H6_SARSC|nr:hypothetical protein SSS_10724 [Sarcoptes scabiei]KPM06010.1 ubiquitin-like protein FUBI-like protein [Sarcoptes scabiei]UXI16585.1 zinc finger protein [Sarcoptes scabiei]